MSSCATSATATYFSTQINTVTTTRFSTQLINGTSTAVPVTGTSLSTEAVPTQTLYATECRADTNRNATSVVSSVRTTFVPTSTATLVSASTTGLNGGVVFVTSYSTASATTTYIVYQTSSPVPAASPSVLAQTSTKHSSHTGAIVGGIVGFVALIVIVGLLICLLPKRLRRNRDTRALDDFFKDALNPGEIHSAAPTAGRRGTLLRRKSSMILDLEKEKRRSNSNDEEHWAALTRLSSGQELDEEAASPDCRPRSFSRQSMNGLSRAASVYSLGAGAALDGEMREVIPPHADGAIVDVRDATTILRRQSSTSNWSMGKKLEEEENSRSLSRMHSQMSARSADMLPVLTSGLSSPPGSPELMSQRPILERESWIAPATLTRGGPSYARNAHRLSMTNGPYGSWHGGVPAVYLNHEHQQQQSPQLQALPQGFVEAPEELPDRPKSALGIMPVSEGFTRRSHRNQQRHTSLQWNHRPQRPMSMTSGQRLQARSSVSVSGQGLPDFHPQWSPPLSPTRMAQAQLYAHRPSLRHTYNADYPPSRYSHLDIVKQEEGEGEGKAATAVQSPSRAAAPAGMVEVRHRSLSGGILLKSPVALQQQQRTEAEAPSDSVPSSASTSKKNSLSSRNQTPPRFSSEKEAGVDVFQEKEGDDDAASSPLVSEKGKALLSDNTLEALTDDKANKSSSWFPQGWRARWAV